MDPFAEGAFQPIAAVREDQLFGESCEPVYTGNGEIVPPESVASVIFGCPVFSTSSIRIIECIGI